MHKVSVKISFDDDAQVWWIEESTLAGLRLDDASLDMLMTRIPVAVADLLDAKADMEGDAPTHNAPLDLMMNIQRAIHAMPHAA